MDIRSQTAPPTPMQELEAALAAELSRQGKSPGDFDLRGLAFAAWQVFAEPLVS